MDYPKEGSKSLYDLSDKSIQQAGYAAIVYLIIAATWAPVLKLFDVPPTPWVALVVGALINGLVFGALAFGIFRKSRVAVVIMLVLVVGNQLFTWLILRSPAGTLPSIIVAAFLLRGARRIFQYHAERRMEAQKV
jgi:predicted benzoate:H+ symporter BenE